MAKRPGKVVGSDISILWNGFIHNTTLVWAETTEKSISIQNNGCCLQTAFLSVKTIKREFFCEGELQRDFYFEESFCLQNSVSKDNKKWKQKDNGRIVLPKNLHL